MARTPRGMIFDPREKSVVHCVHRCVRRTRLCGLNPITGEDCSHRKVWLELRMEELSRWFGIEVLNYSVMENHLHVTLRNRPDEVERWSPTKIARHWCLLCPPTHKRKKGNYEPTEAELNLIRNNGKRVDELRLRLSDISWYMKKLAEPLARMSNREDGCPGHFWESRFRSTKLIDEASLLACSVYVDLNPIRAAIAETLEESHHTSVKLRIEAIRAGQGGEPLHEALLPDVPGSWISPVYLGTLQCERERDEGDSKRCTDEGYLSIGVGAYIRLLEWTAQQRRAGKPGVMKPEFAGLFERLGILSTEDWYILSGSFDAAFHDFASKEMVRRKKIVKERERAEAGMTPDRGEELPAKTRNG